MKLIRYREGEADRIGAVKNDGVIDLVDAGSRWRTVREIASAGPRAIAELSALIERRQPSRRLADVRLLAL